MDRDAKSRKSRTVPGNVYPVFFALADGGASRSGYWTATVLSSIEDGTHGKFSRQLFCLSGASGGSVGNAVFYASLYARSHNGNDQPHLDNSRRYLSNDFLSYTLARMLGPDFFKPFFPFDFIYDRAAALERSMESVPGDTLMGRLMATPLSRFIREDESNPYSLPVLMHQYNPHAGWQAGCGKHHKTGYHHIWPAAGCTGFIKGRRRCKPQFNGCTWSEISLCKSGRPYPG